MRTVTAPTRRPLLLLFPLLLAFHLTPAHAALVATCSPSPSCSLCDSDLTIVTRDARVFPLCYQCTDARYLAEGACYGDCGAYPGTVPYGTGTFNRVCRPRCGFGSYDATPESEQPTCRAWSLCPQGTHQVRAPGPAHDRECAENTACAAVGVEYELHKATATSDRVCSDVSLACGVDAEFEQRPPTASSDRVCSAVSPPCGAGQFELQAPTATSDRICGDAAGCGAGEYEVAPPTATSNSVCRALTQCASDDGSEYEARAPTATSDRLCRAVTSCGPLGEQFQAVAPTPTSDAVCASCSPCPAADSRVVSACTATADTVCTVCPTECPRGTYRARPCDADASGDSGCAVCTRCREGLTYVATPCGPGADTQCEPCSSCELGVSFRTAFCTLTMDTQCQPVTVCDPQTEVEVTAPTYVSDRTCGSRPSCGTGEYQTRAPTASTERVCEPISSCVGFCSSGVANDGPCACGSNCNTCLFDRDAGVSECVLCSNSRHLYGGECLASCPSGFRASGTASSFGRQCIPDAAGAELPPAELTVEYTATAATPTSDRICATVSECGVDAFQTATYTATSDRQCQAYTECTADEYELEDATPARDRYGWDRVFFFFPGKGLGCLAR